MSEKKVVIVNDSSMVRDFLQRRLEEFEIQVIPGLNGLDGLMKIRSELPDLVIVDYLISRVSSLDLLKEKNKDPNARGIPVIMLATNLDSMRLPALSTPITTRAFSSSRWPRGSIQKKLSCYASK
jgi:DNA-binding response OmpR family regulator